MRGRAWSRHEDATLRSLAAAGAKARVIAHTIGRTRNAVIGRAYRQRIELGRGG